MVIDILPEDGGDWDDFPDIFEVGDLGWITSFERLEKLTIKGNVSSISETGMFKTTWHGVLKEKCFFCKKMLNLKELNLYGGGAFAETPFLTRLHEAFPGLETFSMNGDLDNFPYNYQKRRTPCYYRGYYIRNSCDVTLPVDKFIDVLKSLAAVKNLQLSNLIIKVEGSRSDPYFDHLDKYHYDLRDCYVEFQEAFEIIKSQFSIATGLFQIYDDQEYGYSILKEKMKKPVFDKSPPWEFMFKNK